MRDPTYALQRRRQLAAAVVISALVGVASAALAHSAVSPEATAATHVLVDTAPPSAVHRYEYPVSGLIKRAELLGRLVTSPPVVERIGRIADVPPDQIGTGARATGSMPSAFTEPGSEQRANDILASRRRYRIEVQARETTPIVDIYTRAQSPAVADRLANAAVTALQERLSADADAEHGAPPDRVRALQLGSARGATVNAGMAVATAVMAFVVAFALSFLLLRYLLRRRAGSATIRHVAGDASPDDDWPHTTRLTPWMLAFFLAVLWLVPFNDIQLTVQLPIDLKLDRLILPFVAATWAIALTVGGAAAPRMRLTRVHAAVGAFVLCAFLSVILNAGSLNENLELEGSLKALPLLVSYVSLFVIVSSAVRGSEVRPFLTYTLVLAVICALGVIWEYRFQQNLFYTWSAKILPPIFSVPKLDGAAVDDIGRRLVRGPAALPLETVAMLAMALPIGLVRLTVAERWRERLLYGLAACLIFAAAFATFRKSALVAPFSVIITVAYFRRRELLKLSPLAPVLVVLVHVLAPGSLGKTTTQFDPNQLGVTTVSDRAADYDAVRPDVWTHLLFGKGWGSYDHVTYRILDSEILARLVEMGVVGLLAYGLMTGSVIMCAWATIASRDRTWAPPALIGAAAAVSFLVVSALFDLLSFPHATYIFLYTAGFVAVVVDHHKRDMEPTTTPGRRNVVARARGDTSAPSGHAARSRHDPHVARRTG